MKVSMNEAFKEEFARLKKDFATRALQFQKDTGVSVSHVSFSYCGEDVQEIDIDVQVNTQRY